MGDAILTPIWIGGLFYWIIKGFKGKLEDQLNDKYDTRNFWTGCVNHIIACVSYLYFGKVNITEQHTGDNSAKKINKSSNAYPF